MSGHAHQLDYNFDSYDKRLISIFNVIGSYFVDVMFNHIYNASKVNNSTSITDEYKKNVQAYVLAIKNDHKIYRDTVSALHDYFTIKTSYKTISFNKFVDNIVELIVPEDYFDSLNIDEKDEILGSTICELVSNLAVYATKPEMLSKIIDYHSKEYKVTIGMLQQHCTTVLLGKRDTIYNQFLKKIGQAQTVIPMEIVENMRNALKKLVKEKSDLIVFVTKLNEQLEIYKDDIMQLKRKEAKYESKIEELQQVSNKKFKKSSNKIIKHKVRSTPHNEPLREDNIKQSPKHSNIIDKERNKLARLKLAERMSMYNESGSESGKESEGESEDNLSVLTDNLVVSK